VKRKRILVVEDDLYVHKFIQQVLSEKEYEITGAADGAAALETLEKETFDLVMLDYMLPKVSGLEVCKKVRSDARTQLLPIILISALGTALEGQKEKLGVSSIIAKPFNISKMLDEVERILGRE